MRTDTARVVLSLNHARKHLRKHGDDDAAVVRRLGARVLAQPERPEIFQPLGNQAGTSFSGKPLCDGRVAARVESGLFDSHDEEREVACRCWHSSKVAMLLFRKYSSVIFGPATTFRMREVHHAFFLSLSSIHAHRSEVWLTVGEGL